jgi:hypothetical protein
MPTTRRSRRGNKARRVQDVRITDDFAGSDGNKVERILSHLQNSHSQTRLLCSDCYTVGIPTGSATNAIVAGSQVRISDDFASVAAQFETFRVTAIRFDIYDVNPNSVGTAFFGTFHDEYTTATQPVFSSADVVDSPDGQLVPPGSGKLTLTWMAKGFRENDFISVLGNVDFGGLRYSVQPATTAVTNKYQVYWKAIVDFRGRR